MHGRELIDRLASQGSLVVDPSGQLVLAQSWQTQSIGSPVPGRDASKPPLKRRPPQSAHCCANARELGVAVLGDTLLGLESGTIFVSDNRVDRPLGQTEHEPTPVSVKFIVPIDEAQRNRKITQTLGHAA